MVKRFVLFTYDRYYPGGGWNDKAGDFDSVEQARLFMHEDRLVSLGEYYDIVDLWTGEIVEDGVTPRRPYKSPDTTEARAARIAALSVALERQDKSWYSTAVEGARKGPSCIVGALVRAVDDITRPGR